MTLETLIPRMTLLFLIALFLFLWAKFLIRNFNLDDMQIFVIQISGSVTVFLIALILFLL